MLNFIKYFLLTVFGLVLSFGAYLYLRMEPRDVRMKRLNHCISLKLPEIKARYESMGYKLGEPKIWLDWMDREEYATYPLLKNGKHENKKSATISTDADHEDHNAACSWIDIEYSAN